MTWWHGSPNRASLGGTGGSCRCCPPCRSGLNAKGAKGSKKGGKAVSTLRTQSSAEARRRRWCGKAEGWVWIGWHGQAGSAACPCGGVRADSHGQGSEQPCPRHPRRVEPATRRIWLMAQIVLDYVLCPRFLKGWSSLGAEATAVDFGFGIMAGSVIFRIDRVSFDSDWELVPMVDHAGGLYDTVKNLDASGCRTLQFAEVEHALEFVCDEDMVVRLFPSWSRATVSVPHSELLIATRDFYRRVLNDLAKGWPSLAESAEYKRRHGRAYSD